MRTGRFRPGARVSVACAPGVKEPVETAVGHWGQRWGETGANESPTGDTQYLPTFLSPVHASASSRCWRTRLVAQACNRDGTV